MSASIDWQGLDAMFARMNAYQESARLALRLVADYWAPVIESFSKENAPWTDRTGNARQGMTGFVQDISETTVAIYLAHRMDYGIYLETAFQARYATVMPSLETHYKPVMDMLHKVFS